MCSEYSIKTKVEEVAKALGTSIKASGKDSAWDSRIKFTNFAPVVTLKANLPVIGELVFPANPFPNSRLSQASSNKNKTSTDESSEEDQIVRIYDIPMWREGFSKNPCLVPMTSFFEPAYWGDHAGEVIEFKHPEEQLLFVPGFMIKPRVPSTGKLNGFTLLTHTASEQMLNYHHRLLVLLKPKEALEYLFLDKEDPVARFDFLLKHRLTPKFKTSKDRTMAKGWEKRVEDHESSLADENKYRAILAKEQVSG